MPKLLDRGDSRAYYLAEGPLRSGFLQGRKLALSNFLHEELLVCHPEQWAHLVKSIAL